MKKVLFAILTAALLTGCAKEFMEDASWEGKYSDPGPGEGPCIVFSNPELEQFCLDTYDFDGDKCIRLGDVADVTKVDCSGRGMSSLDGIEDVFPKMDTLVCSGNLLESLNLSLTHVNVLYANPMNDKSGRNVLKYIYVARGQEIEYVTSNRKDAPDQRIPSGTVVIAVPVSK